MKSAAWEPQARILWGTSPQRVLSLLFHDSCWKLIPVGFPKEKARKEEREKEKKAQTDENQNGFLKYVILFSLFKM